MKRSFFLVSAIVLATLASCTKDSKLDPTIESAITAQTEIEFSTYASSSLATKGTPVNSNDDFQGIVEDGEVSPYGSFNVVSLISDATFDDFEYYSNGTIESYTVTPTKGEGVYYFGLAEVTYSDSKWVNGSKMYWPNYSKILHFAACSPSGIIEDNYSFTQETDSDSKLSYEYKFDYTVDSVVKDQIDLMYALTSFEYLAPSDKHKNGADSYITTGIEDTNDEDPVNLHFKHALTQIAFTAIKDSYIEVYVKGITVCNIYNSGTFTATAVTDDEDTIDGSTDSSTVGDSLKDGDKVNANNFGTWKTKFEGGWNNLTLQEDSSYSYYAVVGSGGLAAMSNYELPFADYTDISFDGSTKNNSIKISSSGVTNLTSEDEVLMLMPQTLTAWVPNTSTVLNYAGCTSTEGDTDNLSGIVGADEDADFAGYNSVSTAEASLSYLAIDCEIYHTGASDYGAKIHDGYIFVPFETKDIAYSQATVDGAVENADEWLAGYRITYCLNFGGGYVVEEGHTTIIPEPGCTPDTDTYTLREITYTTTVDAWVDASGGNLSYE